MCVCVCRGQADLTYYYHSMIESLKGIGYMTGRTLFGFGYDWRQVRPVCVCVWGGLSPRGACV